MPPAKRTECTRMFMSLDKRKNGEISLDDSLFAAVRLTAPSFSHGGRTRVVTLFARRPVLSA